jgi:hypothetical protein
VLIELGVVVCEKLSIAMKNTNAVKLIVFINKNLNG